MAPSTESRTGPASPLTTEKLTRIGGTFEKNAPTDFSWVATDEPHRTRRGEILAAHPEVRTLFGPEPLTIPITVFLVVAALLGAWFIPSSLYSGKAAVASTSWLPSRTMLIYHISAFAYGGTLMNSIFLAIHEITHCLACKRIQNNFYLAVFANFPVIVPYSVTFKGYHALHHQYQGVDGYDTDIPTIAEARLLTSWGVFGKFFFLFFQIIFYALRSMFVRSLPFSRLMAQAIVYQIAFDIIFIGARYITLDPVLGTIPSDSPVFQTVCGWVGIAATQRAECTALTVLWLLLSLFYAGCFHPVSGHFIAEHFEFEKGHETYSYYGPLNWLAFNVGYHNEHHDFPNIPWSRLPALRRMAREFYDPLPQHESWPGVLWRFLAEPVNCWSRVKRPQDVIKARSEKNEAKANVCS